MGCRSNQRSFGPVLHLTFLNVTEAVSFPQVFPAHCPALMDGLHHIPRFGGVPTHIARAKLNGVCFLPVLIDFSIVQPSLILQNKNQLVFDFDNSFCIRAQASTSRATAVGAVANECGDGETSVSE